LARTLFGFDRGRGSPGRFVLLGHDVLDRCQRGAGSGTYAPTLS